MTAHRGRFAWGHGGVSELINDGREEARRSETAMAIPSGPSQARFTRGQQSHAQTSASTSLVGHGAAYGSTWVRAFVTGLEALVRRGAIVRGRGVGAQAGLDGERAQRRTPDG